jgi:NADPH-dependent 2,4-dienoyl-CoA reductase/sulfur reductase-like enzyme
MKAAATARRRQPDLDILVLQDEPEVSYSACGLPFSLGDPAAIPRAKSVARSVERFRTDGIDLRVRHRVEEVDLSARRARVRSVVSGELSAEPFDQILFATGAQAIQPRMPVAEGAPPVLPLRSLADADRLRGLIRPDGRAVIIGGGYIGRSRRSRFVLCSSLFTGFRPCASHRRTGAEGMRILASRMIAMEMRV